MKRENKLFAFCFYFLLLVGGGCSSSDGPDIDPQEDPKEEPKEEVRFTVSLNGVEMTKANIAGTEFEEGDNFKLYFNSNKPKATEDGYVRVYTLQSSKQWTSPSPMYWDDQAKESRDITAITPYSAHTTDDGSTHGYGHEFSDTDLFTVKQDQSVTGNYQLSDLLIARTNTNKRLIPLPFYHMLSRVYVTVSASTKENDPDGWFEASAFNGLTVKLHSMAMKANVTYGTATESNAGVVVTGNKGTDNAWEGEITMFPLNDTFDDDDKKKSVSCSFIAIVPPLAALNAGDKLLSIKIPGDEGKTYVFKPTSAELPSGGFTQQGKQTSINVVLKKRDVLAELETDIEITAWGEGPKATVDNPIILK